MFSVKTIASTPTNVAKIFRPTKTIASVGAQKFASVGSNFGELGGDAEASYTPEQRVSILTKLNTCTTDELMKYKITQARLRKLTAHRDKCGGFKSVNEVMMTQGLDVDVLDKFCKSLVKGESGTKDKAFVGNGELLTPALDNDVRAGINTSTGIWVYGNFVSWAQLDKSCNLLSWECESLGDVEMKNGLVAVVEAVANIVSKVPVSHAYTMETDPIIPFSRMNSVAYYLHLQRQQVVSTIVSLLGMREKPFKDTNESRTLTNNVYMMRSRAPARLFDLQVGSEIVSAKTVVDKMFNDREDSIIPISADISVRQKYRSRDIYEREQMNWALLLTSAFVNLSVLKTATLKKSNKKFNDRSKPPSISI